MPFGDNLNSRILGRKKYYFSKFFGWPPHVGMRNRAANVNRLLKPKWGDLILEVGSSSGVHSSYLAKKRAKVFGFDLKKKLVYYSKKVVHRSKNGLTPSFLVANAEDIPFKDGTFDKVISVDVLEHVENDRKALEEIGRVLKPHGYIVIHVPLDVRFHISPLKLSRARAKKEEIGLDHVRDGYIREDLEDIFRSSGFVIDKIMVTSRFFTAIAWEIDNSVNHRMRYFPFLYALTKLDRFTPPIGNGFVIKAHKKNQI